MAHYEITRTNQRPLRPRYARHWSDLYRLGSSDYFERILEANDIRDEVIAVKSKQFTAAGVDYKLCATGSLQIVPEGTLLDSLEKDYKEMVNAGMFLVTPLPFLDILKDLQKLEDDLNSLGTESD